jgi:Ca2+-binding RTX toxin-like protein
VASLVAGGSGLNGTFDDLGSDTLTGGDGADMFCFPDRREGRDVITDFTFDVDVTDHSAVGITGISQLAISLDGADTLIEFGRTAIRLEGFGLSLIEADFIFA